MFNKLCKKLLKINRKSVRKMHVMVSLVLALSLSTGIFTAFAEGLNQVRLVIDDKWYVYKTAEKTVGEFLKKEGIKLHKEDIIDTDLDKEITGEIFIKINKAETVVFIVDGEKSFTYTTNEPVLGNVLRLFEKEQNKKYYLNDGQSSASAIHEGMKIKISSYTEKINKIVEKIPFETKIVENKNLYVGEEKISTKGEEGIKEVLVKETYKKDKIVEKDVMSIQTVKEPITQVIQKGTKKKPEKKKKVNTGKGEFSYSKVLNMKSSAYTAGYESTGKVPGQKGYGVTASGLKAQKGIVAVDTNVIPFGTKLYVEGYGYAMAGDKGSAIKGNKIDVFFDKYNDAINWGVRNVKVYVLS